MADEIYRLRELKQKALVAGAEREGVKQRITEMRTFIYEQPYEIVEYDENMVHRLIQKVIIYEDKYTVEFKSGIEVEGEYAAE